MRLAPRTHHLVPIFSFHCKPDIGSHQLSPTHTHFANGKIEARGSRDLPKILRGESRTICPKLCRTCGCSFHHCSEPGSPNPETPGADRAWEAGLIPHRPGTQAASRPQRPGGEGNGQGLQSWPTGTPQGPVGWPGPGCHPRGRPASTCSASPSVSLPFPVALWAPGALAE